MMMKLRNLLGHCWVSNNNNKSISTYLTSLSQMLIDVYADWFGDSSAIDCFVISVNRGIATSCQTYDKLNSTFG